MPRASEPVDQKAALDRFTTALSRATKKNPTPAVGTKSSEQMRYFRSVSVDLLVVETAGLPNDLATAFEEFRKPLVTISGVLDDLPADLNWDDAQGMTAFITDLKGKDLELWQRLIATEQLAAESSSAGTRFDTLLSRYGIVLD